MLSFRVFAAAILALTISGQAAWSQSDDSASAKDAQQVSQDNKQLAVEQKQLDEYKAQAAWYDQFAQKRLQNASAERNDVEKRLQAVEGLLAQKKDKDPKSHLLQEQESLKAWLNEESAKEKAIETTRERWHSAVKTVESQIAQTKYQKDVDKASLEHQKDIDKASAARQADNPKPVAPQLQQNTVLMPGFETEPGKIPTLLGPNQ